MFRILISTSLVGECCIWYASLFSEAISCKIDVQLMSDRLELAADRRLRTSKSDAAGERKNMFGCCCCWRRNAAAAPISCNMRMSSE